MMDWPIIDLSVTCPLGGTMRPSMHSRKCVIEIGKTSGAMIFVMIILVALCPACAQTPNPYVPIKDSNERIDVVLASVLPPRGGGWMLWRENPAKVRVGKLGSANGQSYAGIVGLSKLPELRSMQEFFDLTSKQRARDSGDPRFEDILAEEKVVSENGIWVFHYHIKYKDFGANNLPGSDDYLVVEDYGASFRHPFEKSVAVNVALSHRSRREDARSDFEEVAEEFVRSIEFNELPTGGTSGRITGP